MSTTDLNAPAAAGQQVTLPPGWSAGPARETTSTNAAGQITQGVQVPISSATGTTATVFIPNLALEQGPAAVQPIFNQKIAALQALPGGS
jgi:hypothetical protein